MSEPILSIKDLIVNYTLDAGIFASSNRFVSALKGISLDIEQGETYGLVGESGSGKTTLARSLVRLVKATSGEIYYIKNRNRNNVLALDQKDLKSYRSEIKYVFQDPASSLDPRLNIYQLLTMGIHYSRKNKEKINIDKQVHLILKEVGLDGIDLKRKPSEFSGGQRQRISLARALMFDPSLLICDEVVSALDVSIQGQILNLLTDLKKDKGLTLIFIAHDLTVVGYMADRIGVLYQGCLMEEGPAEVFQAPLHPYSKLLYSCIPHIKQQKTSTEESMEKKNMQNNNIGCPFQDRCPLVMEMCKKERPPLREVSFKHKIACFAI